MTNSPLFDLLLGKCKGRLRNTTSRIVWNLVMLYCLLQEQTAPMWSRLLALSGIIYFVIPIDLYPDWFPGGYGDDIILIAITITNIAGALTDELKERAWKIAPNWCKR